MTDELGDYTGTAKTGERTITNLRFVYGIGIGGLTGDEQELAGHNLCGLRHGVQCRENKVDGITTDISACSEKLEAINSFQNLV